MKHALVGCLATASCLIGAVDFNREIRPILSDSCFTCHGPDDKQRQVNLRLDTKDGMFADRGGSAVIVPGDSAKSRLYQRVSAPKPAMRMPPPGSGRTLTGKQVDTIRRWIDEGAKWEEHWAYVPPIRPALPQVKDARWPRNPIDNFILARLEREGLKPSAEADKITLIRRLTFDLTGLPPTPAEISAFLADKSPTAYDNLVDRLLASPHYGERMAMQWFDLARYADTHGYHIDSHRDMWPWRDWVIQAFNRNLPYDQFTLEQLAGDLLPSPTRQQLVATGFNRNHMINFEGGAIPEEYQNEYVVDRVEATSTVWMGMTMGCARCHDHKYDPIKQREFYQFYAFFNNIPEKGLDGRTGNAEPVVQLPDEIQERQLEELNREIAAKEEMLPGQEIAQLQAEWEKVRVTSLPQGPREGLTAHYEFDGSLVDTSGHYRHGRLLSGKPFYSTGRVREAAEFVGDATVELGGIEAKPFAIVFWFRPTVRLAMKIFEGIEFSFEDFEPAPDLKRAQYLTLKVRDSVELRTKERIILGDWYHLALNYDGSTLALYLNGKPHETVPMKNAYAGVLKISKSYRGHLDDLRIYDRPLTGPEVESLFLHLPVRSILESTGKRSKDQQDRVRDFFLTFDAPDSFRKAYASLKLLKAQKERLDKNIVTAMIMQEMETPRETFILGRGDYRNKGEKVSPGVPAMLPPFPLDAPRNRLGLAKWLLDPAHPLTSRVAVNRFWQMYFGTGIVKTVEDFGSQGEAPSHPELLDWLATEFLRAGWDIKRMQRLIVTSAAYRQSSKVTQPLLEKDPENRLIARGPRFRLQAEMIRDAALASSGLLQETSGGPGVYPYQPKGVWEDIAYGDIWSAQTYAPSHGSDLYRRSMYTFWKRTAPPPGLNTFDAPDREKCAARRPVTNTPLQALVLMNDPTYIEAARVLAEKAILEGGRDRIGYAFQRVLGRKPAAPERRVLQKLAGRKISLDLLRVGESPVHPGIDPAELARWTIVTSTILNLDEAITKQ